MQGCFYRQFLPNHLTVIALVFVQLFCWTFPAWAAFDHSHLTFTKELKKYVDGPLVHYASWKQHPQGLGLYLKQLETLQLEEYKKFTESQKKALWINAYNAIMIKIVLEHYPIKGDKPYYPPHSMRQIPNVWESQCFKVAGQDVNLYRIEHDIIRREFSDPRMHFVVVCASKGCPRLHNSAYVSETIEQDLDEATKEYFANPNNIQYDPQGSEIRVSKLFKWFPLDFASQAGLNMASFPPPSDDAIVLSYVLRHAPAEIRSQLEDKEIHITYRPFDWLLNDADEKQ
ncbi:MAG: DUF547 domain-containing protein [Candidatus Melainabacteria bacterium]|nr:DUF547 domain-containing protein [Candidatus Melainabacteria bacterium]